MAALEIYRGANTPAQHAAEAKRLGGDNAYHVQLVNALLGAVQTEAVLADSLPISPDARRAAYEQQLKTAGAADNPARRIDFLRWQTLRVAGSLREIAQNVEAGPIPLAAAHAAEGLRQLLSVIADSQDVTPADVDRLAGQVTDELRAASSRSSGISTGLEPLSTDRLAVAPQDETCPQLLSGPSTSDTRAHPDARPASCSRPRSAVAGTAAPGQAPRPSPDD